jgi:hypothetical protein
MWRRSSVILAGHHPAPARGTHHRGHRPMFVEHRLDGVFHCSQNHPCDTGGRELPCRAKKQGVDPSDAGYAREAAIVSAVVIVPEA